MSSMPRPRPPYLHKETNRHGSIVWYVHMKGSPRIRLRAAYGTKGFWAEYQAAMQGQPQQEKSGAKSGTLRWLYQQYHNSSSWGALSVATRRQRENIFRHVLSIAGDVPFSEITRKHIIEGRERRKDTPAMANNFVKATRGMFKWAVEMEYLTADPTRDVSRLKVKSEGIHTWTEDEVERFEARWPIGTRERVAFDVLLYTGLRRGDAVRLGRQHVDKDGVFAIRTEKTGTEINAPILPMLDATLKAGPTGDLAFIAGERGRPMVKESFGTWFKAACVAAGVPGSAHGLRKAGATRLANNGATVAQLEAIFGWSGAKMASLYTRTADRKKLAKAAMSMLKKEHA
jgi:integrase